MKHALSFAQHLDNNEFQLAKAMIADTCIYKFRDQTLTGADSIMNCYKGSFDSVADQLDKIFFTSRVEQIGPQSYKMFFTDRIEKSGEVFEHQCAQTIRFETDRIVEICHIDLPGETESLNAFFKRHKIIRKTT